MRPWFERDPKLLEREISALQQLGAIVEIDEDARATGVLRLLIDYPAQGGRVDLIGHYPDLYPFFRPEVLAPSLSLPRHQQPNSKGLCLIGRRTSHWFASETLAGLLEQQFPRLWDLAQGGAIDDVVPFEEPQGEPVSEYYNWEAPAESLMLIDSAWQLNPSVRQGTFTAMCHEFDREGTPSRTIKGYISEVRDMAGAVLASHDGPQVIEGAQARKGRWLRIDNPPLGNINDVLDSLEPALRNWLEAKETWPPARHLSLGAIVFPEEVQHRTFADGWSAIQWLSSRLKKGLLRQIWGSFVRTSRAGLVDLAARMPAGRLLESKTVLLAGVGAIGAPVALELARAGIGHLILADHDYVEPATIRRWPVGIPAFGDAKVAVLKDRIEREYPWTKVTAERMRIGVTEEPSGEPKQGEQLATLLDAADLVIDCTVELGINHVLSEMVRVRGEPLVIGSATPGGWGGRVAHFTKNGVCWLCYREALYGAEPLAAPPYDPAGELQPPGCAEPTFTGSAFDLTEVSLELVRIVCGLLTSEEGGYPAPRWQAAMLTLRSEEGQRVPPKWTALELAARTGCDCSK